MDSLGRASTGSECENYNRASLQGDAVRDEVRRLSSSNNAAELTELLKPHAEGGLGDNDALRASLEMAQERRREEEGKRATEDRQRRSSMNAAKAMWEKKTSHAQSAAPDTGSPGAGIREGLGRLQMASGTPSAEPRAREESRGWFHQLTGTPAWSALGFFGEPAPTPEPTPAAPAVPKPTPVARPKLRNSANAKDGVKGKSKSPQKRSTAARAYSEVRTLYGQPQVHKATRKSPRLLEKSVKSARTEGKDSPRPAATATAAWKSGSEFSATDAAKTIRRGSVRNNPFLTGKFGGK